MTSPDIITEQVSDGQRPEQQAETRGDGGLEGQHGVQRHRDRGVVQRLPQGLSQRTSHSRGIQENLWKFFSIW